MSEEMELSLQVKEKLSEAVDIFAQENLTGKPVVLGYIVYQALEKTLIQRWKEIVAEFK
jgi:hypothetical protein